ncbi:hypothetical protein N7463_001273 [Penicillium fimorum]|uniref:C3H1-type domain-containing protein n=1 Tax=Penicillium fimorum TaxID=1882269 RepID=A0A9W9Y5U2_9EURO|nr:hypothetical protein N7463_001273 [Penicillium fimorum]
MPHQQPTLLYWRLLSLFTKYNAVLRLSYQTGHPFIEAYFISNESHTSLQASELDLLQVTLLTDPFMMARRGNWGFRGRTNTRGGFNSRKRNEPEIPCVHFQRGWCNYGERCKFSHDVTKAANANLGLNLASDSDARNQYFDWRRFLRNGLSVSGYPPIEQELVQFWNGALEILESDSRENHQFLAKDLVDDNLHGY